MKRGANPARQRTGPDIAVADCLDQWRRSTGSPLSGSLEQKCSQ